MSRRPFRTRTKPGQEAFIASRLPFGHVINREGTQVVGAELDAPDVVVPPIPPDPPVLHPPVITSALTATITTGQPFSYQITATNSPTSFGATGLPAGLSFNGATGLISGTPTVTAVANIPISATNADGTDNQVLVLTVAPPAELNTVLLGITNTGALIKRDISGWSNTGLTFTFGSTKAQFIIWDSIGSQWVIFAPTTGATPSQKWTAPTSAGPWTRTAAASPNGLTTIQVVVRCASGWIATNRTSPYAVFRSTDGVTWTAVSGQQYAVDGVATPTGNIFLGASSTDYGTPQIRKSSDGGVTWSVSKTSGASSYFQPMGLDDTRIIGYVPANQIWAWSDDEGGTWSTGTGTLIGATSSAALRSVVRFKDRYYTKSYNAHKIVRSADASSPVGTSLVLSDARVGVGALVVYKGLIVASAETPGTTFESTDGSTWTAITGFNCFACDTGLE